jgi:hypothetical protein
VRPKKSYPSFVPLSRLPSKQEVDALRKKHWPLGKPPQPAASAKPKPAPAPITPLHPAAPLQPTRALCRPSTLSEVAAADEDNSEDFSDNDDRCPLEAPVWSARPPRPSRCAHCHDEGCCGCACMCLDSAEWLTDHDHYFATCKCGNDDCPGCKCVCPMSTVLIEHGGHVRAPKIRIFTSP